MIAVDTNVFVGAIQTFNPVLRTAARHSIKHLFRQGEQLYCFPQNLVEFWNVATRPATANGLGLSPEQTARLVDRFQTIIQLLPETRDIFPAWRTLVLQYRVAGIHVHDARIVAALVVHRVPRILTFDVDDFKRYTQVAVIDPKSV
jgi:predicted nucleic acid-binding protein